MNSSQFNNDFDKEEFSKHRNVTIKSERSTRIEL